MRTFLPVATMQTVIVVIFALLCFANATPEKPEIVEAPLVTSGRPGQLETPIALEAALRHSAVGEDPFDTNKNFDGHQKEPELALTVDADPEDSDPEKRNPDVSQDDSKVPEDSSEHTEVGDDGPGANEHPGAKKNLPDIAANIGVIQTPTEIGIAVPEDPKSIGIHKDPESIGVPQDPKLIGVPQDSQTINVLEDPKSIEVPKDPESSPDAHNLNTPGSAPEPETSPVPEEQENIIVAGADKVGKTSTDIETSESPTGATGVHPDTVIPPGQRLKQEIELTRVRFCAATRHCLAELNERCIAAENSALVCGCGKGHVRNELSKVCEVSVDDENAAEFDEAWKEHLDASAKDRSDSDVDSDPWKYRCGGVDCEECAADPADSDDPEPARLDEERKKWLQEQLEQIKRETPGELQIVTVEPEPSPKDPSIKIPPGDQESEPKGGESHEETPAKCPMQSGSTEPQPVSRQSPDNGTSRIFGPVNVGCARDLAENLETPEGGRKQGDLGTAEQKNSTEDPKEGKLPELSPGGPTPPVDRTTPEKLERQPGNTEEDSDKENLIENPQDIPEKAKTKENKNTDEPGTEEPEGETGNHSTPAPEEPLAEPQIVGDQEIPPARVSPEKSNHQEPKPLSG